MIQRGLGRALVRFMNPQMTRTWADKKASTTDKDPCADATKRKDTTVKMAAPAKPDCTKDCPKEKKEKPKVDPPPVSATSCTPSVIEGITGGRTDICLYVGAPCEVEPCKAAEWSKDAIPPHEDATVDPPPDANVVVIGAGLAGLAAASHLVKNRIVNTTVLEASPRPGGRIKSVMMNGKVLEMGAPCPASYRRTCNCPVTSLAVQHGFMQPGEPDKTNGLLVNCDGSERPLPICMMAFNEFLVIREELKCVRYPPGEEEELIQSFLKIRLNHLMESVPEDSMEVTIRTIAGLLSMIATPRIAIDAAAPFLVAGGIRVPMGHIALIGPYIEQIGPDRILFNKRVTKIKWGTVTKEQRPRALVVCSDGTSYKADYVLVTVPLGVLKSEVDTLFCPALPAPKTNAIAKVNLSFKEVMYMSWASSMWVWRESPLNRTWSKEDMECRDGWLKALRSIEEVPGTDNMLKVTLEGPESILFCKLSDVEVMKEFTDFLREWQGDKRIPLPLMMSRSNWSVDKHYRGSLPSATSPDVEKEFTKPVPFGCGEDPTIFFAGDATAPNACGTIGGALVSGFREAEHIANLIIDSHTPQQHPCFTKCCIKNPKSTCTPSYMPF